MRKVITITNHLFQKFDGVLHFCTNCTASGRKVGCNILAHYQFCSAPAGMNPGPGWGVELYFSSSPFLHSPQFEISCEMWSSRLHVWGGGQVQLQGRSSTSYLWWNFLCFSMVIVSQYCFLDILGPGTRNINHKLKFLHHARYGSVRIASGRTGPLTNGVCCGWC